MEAFSFQTVKIANNFNFEIFFLWQVFHPDQLQQHQQVRQPPAPLLLSPMEVSSPGSCYSLSDIKTEELTEEDMMRYGINM